MTLREMQQDLLKRLYETSIKELESAESSRDSLRILHEAANVFAFSIGKAEEAAD